MATNSITISDIVVVVVEEEIKWYAGDCGIQLLRRDQKTSYSQLDKITFAFDLNIRSTHNSAETIH